VNLCSRRTLIPHSEIVAPWRSDVRQHFKRQRQTAAANTGGVAILRRMCRLNLVWCGTMQHEWDDTREINPRSVFFLDLESNIQHLYYTPPGSTNDWFEVHRSRVWRDYGTTAMLSRRQFREVVRSCYLDSNLVHPRDVVVVGVPVSCTASGTRFLPAWFVAVACRSDHSRSHAVLVRFNCDSVHGTLNDRNGPFAEDGGVLMGAFADYFGPGWDGARAFRDTLPQSMPTDFRLALVGVPNGQLSMPLSTDPPHPPHPPSSSVARTFMPSDLDDDAVASDVCMEEHRLSDRKRRNEKFEEVLRRNDTGVQHSQSETETDSFRSLVPREFYCSVTHELMIDPVVCTDGFSYERSAIKRWLSGGRTTSPMTGCGSLSMLCPNRNLRIAVEHTVDCAIRYMSRNTECAHREHLTYQPSNSYDSEGGPLSSGSLLFHTKQHDCAYNLENDTSTYDSSSSDDVDSVSCGCS
jgi:hypothetical protein